MVHDTSAAMERLAAELQGLGLEAKMISVASGPLTMRVRNPAVIALSETIIGHADAFWWPWKAQIGPLTDAAGVAAVIARVLAVIDPR
jgi:hypothetical protein